jgi:hypothetical protein
VGAIAAGPVTGGAHDAPLVASALGETVLKQAEQRSLVVDI